MPNNLLVTGLALGKDFDTCAACNFDLEWLLRYPSILVWADKLIIPESVWQEASSGQYYILQQYPELCKCIKLIFDIARSEGIIKLIDPKNIITQPVSDEIAKQVAEDRIQLAKLFPDNITLGDDQKVPGQIFVGGAEYCTPHIWTIYASLALSKACNAHCLFDSGVLDFCRYKFGLSAYPPQADTGTIETFHSIFEAYLPNAPIFPEYITVNRELCATCAHENACKDSYLSKLEHNLKHLLTWRDYDEILQLKSVVSAIVDKRNKSNGIIDAHEIRNEFLDTQKKLRRRIKLLFPKIKRWSNITTLVSIPVALTGAATGLPLLYITAGSIAGLAQAAKQTTEYLSSKYSWTGFISKDVELHSE